jgi:indole-3-glycerol phosphate synthase
VSVLDDIMEGVRADLEQRQREVTLDQLKEMARQAPTARDALAALAGDDVAVIAEVKRGSPPRSTIRPHWLPTTRPAARG